MSTLSLTEKSPGYYIVDGDLTFANIDKGTSKAFKFLKGMEIIYIDLATVKSTDSAGLALMIEWIKICQNSRIRLIFKNIPKQLHALAKLSGFDKNEYFAGDAS